MSYPLNNPNKVSLPPFQNFYRYGFYVHFYSSAHLQTSSALSINSWLVLTLTRSWSWPSSSHWRSEREIQQLAILEAPTLSLPKNLSPFSVYLPAILLFWSSSLFTSSLLTFPSSPPLSRRHSFHFRSSMQLHSSPSFAPPHSCASKSHTPRERPPHAFPCSSNGEIPTAKIMTANKTQLNFKNMLCSH